MLDGRLVDNEAQLARFDESDAAARRRSTLPWRRSALHAVLGCMSLINPFLADTGTPPIPAVQGWAQQYDGAHGALIDLCQAVPSYPPPDALLQHLAEAAGDASAARYGPIAGDLALRGAYAAHLSRVYGGRVDVDAVAITAGCNQAYFVAVMAVARHGDVVLVPTPWYFNHSMSLQMLGIEARPVPCHAETGFVPDLREIEARIDGRVRALVLVSPNNPTGAVYSTEAIARLYDLCRRHGIWLVIDETYRDFLPRGQERPHGLLAGSAWPDRLVQLYSFSKAFAIPGHRLGALAGPPALVLQALKVMDCVQICAARAGQKALSRALGTQTGWQAANRSMMNDRADSVRSMFDALEGWQLDSCGAYFAYARHPFADRSAWQVAERLATTYGVACLPGPAFAGSDVHLRIAFANVDEAGVHDLGRRLAKATRDWCIDN